MSEMMDKIKEILDRAGADTSSFDETEITGPEAPAMDPLEEAVLRSMAALEEIRLYAMYGRTSECEREATEVLEKVTALHTKWVEQNQIMDALTKPAEELNEHA